MDTFTDEQWEERLDAIESIALKNIKKGKKKYYLFLDFDGVINIWCREETDPLFKVRSIKEDDCQFADIPSIKRLSDLCLKYDINIVISSSWRFAGVGYCQRYLKKCGLKKGVKVVGVTAQDFEERQKHITDYLFEHPDFTGYMILDDLYLPYLNKNLIKCETLEGFNEQKCHQAHMMLRQMEVRRSALKCKKYA